MIITKTVVLRRQKQTADCNLYLKNDGPFFYINVTLTVLSTFINVRSHVITTDLSK